jgi:hypothetical protein
VNDHWKYDYLTLQYKVLSISGTNIYLEEKRFDLEIGFVTNYYTVDIATMYQMTQPFGRPTIPCLIASNLTVGDEVWQYGTDLGRIVRQEYHYYLGYQSLFNVVEITITGTMITAHYDIKTGVCCYYNILETTYQIDPASTSIPEFGETICLLITIVLSVIFLLTKHEEAKTTSVNSSFDPTLFCNSWL